MDKISPIKKNILEFIDNQTISKTAFCEATGISYANLKGKGLESEIGGTQLAKILSIYPEINPTWLITSKGEMLLNNSKIVAESHFSLVMDKGKQVPVVEPEVVGGYSSNAFSFDEKDVKEYYSIPVFDKRGVDFIISLTGNSMEPRYLHGDKLACKIIQENAFIEWNKPHVVATRDRGIILKRIRKCANEDFLLMVSEDPNYESFEVPKDEITGIALVIGIVRLE